MEDMYCDTDYTNMTPTRCSVLITSESGDEEEQNNIYYNITASL